MASKFKCPMCGSPTKVVDSRSKTPSITRRRRECINLKCRYRVSTIERIFIKEEFVPKVIKRCGSPPLYLLTIPAHKNFMRVIEAETKQKAREIVFENGWAQKFNWNLTYLGFPARKE